MKAFNLSDIELTKYLFFTGKGGVGKTSIACATAVGLADKGEKILLISTDPASNLQDVFNQTLNGHGTAISEVPGLTVVNLDPEQAAAETGGYLLPVIYAIATGLPVILVAWILAYSVAGLGKFYNRVQIFEKWFRKIVAILFIAIGIYYAVILYL